MQTARPTSGSARTVVSPNPRLHPVNTQTKVIDATQGRILCIADIRGRLSALNDLARDTNAKAIVHTGDFGFFGTFGDHTFTVSWHCNFLSDPCTFQRAIAWSVSMTVPFDTSRCILPSLKRLSGTIFSLPRIPPLPSVQQ